MGGSYITSRTGHIISSVAPPMFLQNEWNDSKYAFEERKLRS